MWINMPLNFGELWTFMLKNKIKYYLVKHLYYSYMLIVGVIPIDIF